MTTTSPMPKIHRDLIGGATKVYTDPDCRYHRLNGPAVERWRRTDKFPVRFRIGWFRHGIQHRTGGPARFNIYSYSGEVSLHWSNDTGSRRLDGPSGIWSKGVLEWTAPGFASTLASPGRA